MTAGPSGSGFSGKPNPRARQQANNAKYGSPLPILLPNSTTGQKGKSKSILSAYTSAFTTEVGVPKCTGIYDPITRSVWVMDRGDVDILFRRGFFGKGTLSRSEPSWRERRVELVKGGSSLAAEQFREKRRLERKQFKIDRAAAMLDAARTAEAVLITGQAPSLPGDIASIEEEDDDGQDEGEGSGRPGSPTPSTATNATSATTVDVSHLTPQTYLVRPTRPDANRNRGRNAFKRKPPPAKPKPEAVQAAPESSTAMTSAPATKDMVNEVDDEVDAIPEEEEFDDTIIEEMEHLQLSLEEAWFLSTAIGVLKILDPETNTFLPPTAVLPLLLTPTPVISPTRPSLRPDDPFLVSYVAYHHFRSLGWVVKPGIKFAADWLLYRRGPVFSHSAFAVVVVPVFEDLEEQQTSPYRDEDWYEERTSWKWMNTIMRVNSLVQKTVIIAYVTVPSVSSYPQSARDPTGQGLQASAGNMSDLLKRYTVREVILSRFGPARRRD